MRSIIILLMFVGLALLSSSCVTTKTIQNEKAMETWLAQATMPVSVRDQTHEFRCRPSLNCYTLIDANGRVFYARNVRHVLPRIIPEDADRIQRSWLRFFY